MILTHGPNVPSPSAPGADTMTATEKFTNDKAHFKSLVEHTDVIVGRILKRLDDLGLSQNTIVMFTGDNGTMSGIETRMRDGMVIGGKGKTTDAGTHVPLIAQWKGQSPSSPVCDDLVDFTDFMTTLADATGATLPSGPDITLDGRSFMPRIYGETPPAGSRPWVFCHYDKNPAKAEFNPKFPRARFARDERFKLYDNGRLYDVASDVLEKSVLAGSPERSEAQRARGALQNVLDSMAVKPDFYTQGGVTREKNLAEMSDEADSSLNADTEAAILELKEKRKECEKGSGDWGRLTEEILRLQGRAE
jgi:arylsulfatase A